MRALSVRRFSGVLGFLAGTAVVYVVALHAVNLTGFRDSPLPLAVTLDLVLTVPVLYYLVLVRWAGVPPVSLIPVFLACLFGAGFVLPEDSRSYLDAARIAGGAAEILLVGYIALRTGRAVRALRGEDDPLHAMRRLLRNALGDHRPAAIAGTEIAVLYYAFFSWRSRPAVRGGRPFSCHRECGWSAVLGVLGVLGAVEVGFVHVLLARWSPVAAWCSTALAVYGMVWMAGDYRALVLRPVLVQVDRLRIRVGLRWEADVPRSRIARVWRPSLRDPKPSRFLNAAVLGDSTVMIELHEETEATGLFGTRRRFRSVGLSVDDPAAFIQELDCRPDPQLGGRDLPTLV